MELTGTIIAIMPAKSGVSARTGNPWMTQEYVIEVPGQYPKKCAFSIFGEDLLDNWDMKTYFDELTGIAEVKPFECVGTVEEVRACVDYMKAREGTIAENSPQSESTVEEILKRFNEEHFLPEKFVEILKSKLHV